VSDLKLTVSSWGQVMLDKRELSKVMRAAGNDVKTKTARLINKSDGGGRHYSAHPATRYRPAAPPYRASSPGQPPAAPTGTLRGSLKTFVYPSGEGFAVRARQFYALFLEVGAYGGASGNKRQHRSLGRTVRKAHAKQRGERREMEPRPFLDRVMEQEHTELDRRVRLALSKALTWKQTK